MRENRFQISLFIYTAFSLTKDAGNGYDPADMRYIFPLAKEKFEEVFTPPKRLAAKKISVIFQDNLLTHKNYCWDTEKVCPPPLPNEMNILIVECTRSYLHNFKKEDQKMLQKWLVESWFWILNLILQNELPSFSSQSPCGQPTPHPI